MTSLEQTYLANKQAARKYARAFAHPDDAGWRSAVNALFAPDAKISVAHPFNDIGGPEAFWEQFIGSLKGSFECLYRRDDILLSGGFNGKEWISSHGYFVGKFTHD